MPLVMAKPGFVWKVVVELKVRCVLYSTWVSHTTNSHRLLFCLVHNMLLVTVKIDHDPPHSASHLFKNWYPPLPTFAVVLLGTLDQAICSGHSCITAPLPFLEQAPPPASLSEHEAPVHCQAGCNICSLTATSFKSFFPSSLVSWKSTD